MEYQVSVWYSDTDEDSIQCADYEEALMLAEWLAEDYTPCNVEAINGDGDIEAIDVFDRAAVEGCN